MVYFQEIEDHDKPLNKKVQKMCFSKSDKKIFNQTTKEKTQQKQSKKQNNNIVEDLTDIVHKPDVKLLVKDIFEHFIKTISKADKIVPLHSGSLLGYT